MSTLAFDKNGKPFTFARNTRKLLVRFFPNSGGRGTCVAMLDDSGEQLYVDADANYLEFRKTVRNQPGLYRLDQCDEDGNEIDDVPPAYVSIGSPRNATGPSDELNALAIVRDLASINAEVSKTIADRFAAVMEKTASILDSAAGAGILDRRLAALAALDAQRAKVKHEQGEEDEDEDDEGAEYDEDEAAKDPWAPLAPVFKMVEPHLPQLGALLFAKLAEFVSKKVTPPPAVATNPVPAPTPAPTPPSPGQGTEPLGATAGSSATPQPQPSSSATAPPAAASSTASPETTTATAPTATTAPTAATMEPLITSPASPATPATPATPALENAPTVAPAPIEAATLAPTETPTLAPTEAPTLAPTEAPPGDVRNALRMPTPEQWTHLYSIRARLSPKEAAIVENAIMRMSPDVLAGWLTELSPLSVDDAVRTIRSMISQLRPPRAPKQGEPSHPIDPMTHPTRRLG